MKAPLKTYLSILFLAIAIIFSGCKGEDGDPGPDGEAGAQGDKGDKGDAGAKGDKGEGFDEAVKYGSITVYLDGTRPDGELFKDTITFRFAPSMLEFSNLYRWDDGSEVGSEYYLRRYLGYYGSNYTESTENGYADVEAEFWTNDGGPGRYSEAEFDSEVVFTAERKYFRLSAYSYFNTYFYPNEDGSGWTEYSEGIATNFSVSDYSYNADTGNVKYKLTYTVPYDYNSTGYDLNVVVVTDAIVFEYLNSPEVLIDGMNRNGRIAPKKVAKAEMKSF